MKQLEQKIISFATALQDVYRDEEDREIVHISKLELSEETLTEDFTAMFYALWAVYCNITGSEEDVIGFTHICNRLVVQEMIESGQVKTE